MKCLTFGMHIVLYSPNYSMFHVVKIVTYMFVVLLCLDLPTKETNVSKKGSNTRKERKIRISWILFFMQTLLSVISSYMVIHLIS